MINIKNLILGLITGVILITGISDASPLDGALKGSKPKGKTITVQVPFDYKFFLVPTNTSVNPSATLNLFGVFLFNNKNKQLYQTPQYILTASSL